MNRCPFLPRAARAALLALLAYVTSPLRAAPPPLLPAWSIAPASEANQASALAVNRKDQVLLWSGPGAAQAAPLVYMVVDVPFDAAQPAVHKALGALGRFESGRSDGPLAYQYDGWAEVILSRRPDLRDALAAHSVRPRLELALQQGAITAAEFDLRLAQARADMVSAPQGRFELDAFKATYASYHAQQTASYGLLGRSQSKLLVDVFDASAAFGRPTTAVRVLRQDETPNPDYGMFSGIRDFNILGGAHTSPTLTGSVVPAAAFNAVRAALVSVSSVDRVQIAPSPAAWVAPVAQPVTAPAIALVPPRADRAPLDAELLPWSEVAGLSGDMITYLHDVLTLPDGGVLISASEIRTARVWRLQQVGGAWKSELVWQGTEGGRQLALSADGRTVWFDTRLADERSAGLVSYDVQTRQTRAFSPQRVDAQGRAQGDADERSLRDLRRWELNGSQLPVFFDHSYLPRDESPLGRDVFQVLQPATPAPAQGGAWGFKPTVNALRQSMMNLHTSNTLIWPVRWRGQPGLWVEDQIGIAELQADNGRVLRAHRVPQRFGQIDRVDATGVAQWVPMPLGSPQAGWVALGFVLMLPDGGGLPPKLDGPGSKARFVGMHVVNVNDGSVCLSALLGRADQLMAAARSANGQLLALGSEGLTGDAVASAALWDAKACQPSVRLAVPPRSGSLHALAFSWNGADLWALTRRGLLRWRLPDGLRDAARAGSLPDQSHN